MDQAVINFPDRFEGKDAFDKYSEEFNETAASLGILNLFGDDIKPDAAAHRAVAEVLDEYELLDPAEKICRRALKLCKTGEEEFYRASCVLSSLLIEQKKKQEACDVAQTAVDCLSAGDVIPGLKRRVYTTLARAQRKLRQYDAALESFSKAKQSDPDGITPGQDLVDELKVVEKKDKAQYIPMLKEWSLVERITWIASDYAESDGEERHAVFCDIASETGEQEFIVKFYQEAIDFLDNLNAALPLRIDLALIYFEVCRQPEKALELLDQVFDARATGLRFPILGGTALYNMLIAVDCMTNVQLEMFRRSRDPAYKAERLTALAGLMQRPFASDVPRTSASWTSFHRVGLAYMYLVMGPLEKFQQVIQSLLDDCFAGLSDSVGWNDAPYLWMLAQSLSLMSKALRNDEELNKCARIVGSAVFSRLGNTDKSEDAEEGKDEEKTPAAEDNDNDAEEPHVDVDTSDDEEDTSDPPTDEGDLVDPEDGYYTCGGFCNPSRKFKWWAGRSAYIYVTFASGLICEECQAEYDAIERGEKKFKGRYFHGLGQDKLKLPVEGWRGVKKGVMRIEGQEDIAVGDFFKKLETEIVKSAWDKIWAGGAF
jgi:tetratricopeptide (TPR) repeat protein